MLSDIAVDLIFLSGISQEQSAEFTLESAFLKIYEWGTGNLKFKDPKCE